MTYKYVEHGFHPSWIVEIVFLFNYRPFSQQLWEHATTHILKNGTKDKLVYAILAQYGRVITKILMVNDATSGGLWFYSCTRLTLEHFSFHASLWIIYS